MNKKYIAIIAVVVVVVAAAAVVASVLLSSSFNPPVDISEVNPSTSLTAHELLPLSVAGEQLVTESVEDHTLIADTDGRTFEVEYTRAEYDGILIHVLKAQSTFDASDTLVLLLGDDSWYGSASSHTQTNDWFTSSKGGRSVFFWRSGAWIFGVDAENENLRNNAADDLIQHLRNLLS